MRVTPFTPVAWRRVLLVAEDARLRDGLGRAVREMGFEVKTASSPEVALRILQEHPQDILIADYHLCGAAGAELVRAVHRSWPDIPGIVLADLTELHSAKKGLSGIDIFDFLAKPCALGELERALERARQRRVQLLPIAPAMPDPPPDDPDEPTEEQRQDHATLEEMERRHILATLEKNNGNRTRTAAELGISLRKLYYRLGQYHRDGLLPR
jgi:DNA-binding NtrC family response regulator